MMVAAWTMKEHAARGRAIHAWYHRVDRLIDQVHAKKAHL